MSAWAAVNKYNPISYFCISAALLTTLTKLPISKTDLALLNSERHWNCTAHFRYRGSIEYRVSLSSLQFQVSHNTTVNAMLAGCQPTRTPIVSRTPPPLPQRRPQTVLHATLDDDQLWMLLPAPPVRGAWLAYPVRRFDGASFNDVDSRLGKLRHLRECFLFSKQKQYLPWR